MRTILFILQKEFIQIFRNRMMVPIIFVVPLVQLIILVNAATMEMKNLDLVVVDQDLSPASRDLISRFTSSPFFRHQGNVATTEFALDMIREDKADLAIIIPSGLDENLIRSGKASIQLLVNAINGTVAGISSAYAEQIIRNWNADILVENQSAMSQMRAKQIQIIPAFWYNPEMNYKVYMVPAILVILVTITGALLAGLNLVREKEMGTIEQINVTPIRKYQFIIGKLVPFWVIAMIELSFGLFLGWLLFNIPMVGNLPLLFLIASIYLVILQSMALLVSTVSNTQQQAMFLIFFFMLIFIMMSGVFTPVESMPPLAQKINVVNPLYYFMKLIRMILLKGSEFRNILPDFGAMVLYAGCMLSLSVWLYRKRT